MYRNRYIKIKIIAAAAQVQSRLLGVAPMARADNFNSSATHANRGYHHEAISSEHSADIIAAGDIIDCANSAISCDIIDCNLVAILEAFMALEAKKTLIMRIYQILDEYSDEDHPLTQQNIIDILDRDYDVVCERKAVGRNVSYLKEMGFDIESGANGTYLASRKFENAELRLLIDSVLSSRNVNSTHSKQLIDKLISFGGQNFKSHVKHVYSLKDWDKSDNKAFFYNIDVIDEAIERGKKIRFNYNKIGLDKKLHVSKSHVGSPYQMFLHSQRYYLMMFDEMFDEVGFYRMDKITDIEILDDDAKPLRQNPGFEKGINYKRIATSLPYMYNDEPIAITMKCWVGMADTLYDWFGTNFTARKIDDRYFEATVVASEKAMLYWVLQYNRNVEVLSPSSLREKVIVSLKKTLALYETPKTSD